MSIEIREVKTSKDRNAFVRLPYSMYKKNPYYVPTLISDTKNTLNPRKNPAFEFCDAKSWIAFRDGKIAGRITGIINHKFIEKWKDKYARFGWIEFEDNIPCTITSTGRKKDVIFDIDIIGKEGRMILFNDAEDTRLYSFIGSPNYSDYRELKVQHIDCVDVNDRFVDAVNDICKVIDGDKAYVNSSGKDGLVALNVIEAFVQSAKMNGKQVKLGC